MITYREIMEYCPSNKIVYDELFSLIRENNQSIVPFVGAGLSHISNKDNQPIYPLWDGVLSNLSQTIEDVKFQKKIRCLIDKKDFEKAAYYIGICLGGETCLSNKMIKIFSEKRLQDDINFNLEAVGLLPELFPHNNVITTNYDCVLETIYAINGLEFNKKLTPNRQDVIKQCEAKKIRFLFKIHGDISGETNEDLIFTRNQYKRRYYKRSPLWNMLCNCFSQNHMLFLGCSLINDETLKVLKSLKNKPTHFAILPCKEDCFNDRRKELISKYNVKAIFYPMGRYESVRLLLERLLAQLKVDTIKKDKAKSFFWGRYPQSIYDNSSQPIEWQILERKDNKVLLISKFGLDSMPFDIKFKDVTWEESSMRKWLNSDVTSPIRDPGFLNQAFNTTEKEQIEISLVKFDEISSSSNLKYEHSYSNDKVFLLDVSEVENYFPSNQDRATKPTDYAKRKGAWASNHNGHNCWYWLRSPGERPKTAVDIDYDGSIELSGMDVNSNFGAVRPAIWLNLDI